MRVIRDSKFCYVEHLVIFEYPICSNELAEKDVEKILRGKITRQIIMNRKWKITLPIPALFPPLKK